MDPQTGEMLMFGYSVIEPYLVYNVVDRKGALVRSEAIDVPWASMLHDFITTSEHVIFPVFPAIFDLAAMMSGGPMMSWQPERGAMLGIMPRSGGNKDVKWFRTDPCFVFHPMNAHTEGRRVICEVAQFPVLPLFEHPDQGPPLLHRWTIDLDSGSVKQDKLDDIPAEFPRIDERYTGRAYAHGYAGGSLRPGGDLAMFDAILHYNVRTGSRSAHALPPGSYTGEPVFVPANANAPEGEGYVLATVYRADERRSDLLILDAENIEKDPLATVKVPHRIPFGFHGNWRPANG
jgi:carotenoid cleavage dioxygenase